MAEAAYILPPELCTNADQEVLPAKIIAVYLHNAKITSSLKKSIIKAYHAPAMETYFTHKHKLTAYDMTHINWSGLKSIMTKLKMHPRSIVAKHINGWLPLQAFLHKQARTPLPCCLICINSFLPERAAHVLMCQHPSAITACSTLQDQCIKTLHKSAHMFPIILQCWDECMRTGPTQQTPTLQMSMSLLD